MKVSKIAVHFAEQNEKITDDMWKYIQTSLLQIQMAIKEEDEELLSISSLAYTITISGISIFNHIIYRSRNLH